MTSTISAFTWFQLKSITRATASLSSSVQAVPSTLRAPNMLAVRVHGLAGWNFVPAQRAGVGQVECPRVWPCALHDETSLPRLRSSRQALGMRASDDCDNVRQIGRAHV